MLVTKLYEYTLLFQAHAQLGFAMVDLVFHLSWCWWSQKAHWGHTAAECRSALADVRSLIDLATLHATTWCTVRDNPVAVAHIMEMVYAETVLHGHVYIDCQVKLCHRNTLQVLLLCH